jgi:hypothetical protein
MGRTSLACFVVLAATLCDGAAAQGEGSGDFVQRGGGLARAKVATRSYAPAQGMNHLLRHVQRH